MKKIVCIMAIGEKYTKLLKLISRIDGCEGGRFKKYASKCKADFAIINNALDPEYHRNLLYQKLLLASKFKSYDLVLYLDMDIIINDNCPSVFELIPEHCGLAAMLAPRNSSKFKKLWQDVEHIKYETNQSYFSARNFEIKDNLIGSINGGVFVSRPYLVEKLFREYYYSSHDQGKLQAYEEAPMAYYSQINNIFYPLDEKFNCQFLYEVCTPLGEKIINRKLSFKEKLKNITYSFTYKNRKLSFKEKLRNITYSFIYKKPKIDIRYFDLIDELLINNYIIHLSGDLKDLHLEYELR